MTDTQWLRVRRIMNIGSCINVGNEACCRLFAEALYGTRRATPWNGASAGSNAGAAWPPVMTNTPNAPGFSVPGDGLKRDESKNPHGLSRHARVSPAAGLKSALPARVISRTSGSSAADRSHQAVPAALAADGLRTVRHDPEALASAQAGRYVRPAWIACRRLPEAARPRRGLSPPCRGDWIYFPPG